MVFPKNEFEILFFLTVNSFYRVYKEKLNKFEIALNVAKRLKV